MNSEQAPVDVDIPREGVNGTEYHEYDPEYLLGVLEAEVCVVKVKRCTKDNYP